MFFFFVFWFLSFLDSTTPHPFPMPCLYSLLMLIYSIHTYLHMGVSFGIWLLYIFLFLAGIALSPHIAFGVFGWGAFIPILLRRWSYIALYYMCSRIRIRIHICSCSSNPRFLVSRFYSLSPRVIAVGLSYVSSIFFFGAVNFLDRKSGVIRRRNERRNDFK